MPKFKITAEVTISVHTTVEAGSLKEAIAEARDRPVMRLCGYCADQKGDEQWVTSGELDGEPTNLQEDA